MKDTDFAPGLTRRLMLQQLLMDNISDHIYFKDRSGRIMLVNRAYARWFGHFWELARYHGA